MTDFLGGIEADERAMEKIATALTRIAIVMEKRYEKKYPTKVPRDAVVTTIPSEEDELKESLGSTGEALDDWLGGVIGPREAKLIIKNKK